MKELFSLVLMVVLTLIWSSCNEDSGLVEAPQAQLQYTEVIPASVGETQIPSPPRSVEIFVSTLPRFVGDVEALMSGWSDAELQEFLNSPEIQTDFAIEYLREISQSAMAEIVFDSLQVLLETTNPEYITELIVGALLDENVWPGDPTAPTWEPTLDTPCFDVFQASIHLATVNYAACMMFTAETIVGAVGCTAIFVAQAAIHYSTFKRCVRGG